MRLREFAMEMEGCAAIKKKKHTGDFSFHVCFFGLRLFNLLILDWLCLSSAFMILNMFDVAQVENIRQAKQYSIIFASPFPLSETTMFV